MSAHEFKNPFAVRFASRAGIHNAPEGSAPFVGNEKVIAGTVGARFTARRTSGNELSTMQPGIFKQGRI